MISAFSPEKDLRSSLLSQSQNFLLRLEGGATNEYLLSELFQIRVQEFELMKCEKLMLHPGIWNILFCRYINRKTKEILDTLN